MKNKSDESGERKQRAFLAPDVIISMLTGDKKALVILRQKHITLVTSDFALYEAISSVTKEELKLSILEEFLFNVEAIHSPKIEKSMERITHLRNVAKLSSQYKTRKENEK